MMRQSIAYPPPVQQKSMGALSVTTIVFGVFSMLACGTAIGVTLGYGPLNGRTMYGSFVSIPANFGLIYVTCRLMFLITAPSFPDSAGVRDLQENVARMLAFTMLVFSVWVTSLVWFVLYGTGYYDSLTALFGSGFSFVFGIIMTGLSGGLVQQTSSKIQQNLQNIPLQQMVSPSVEPGHTNPGYEYPPAAVHSQPQAYSDRPALRRY